MTPPTLIDMPEPSSNPDTPTEMPGTPNSTATSLSALSTTAIKDGHRGTSFPYGSGGHHTNSNNMLEAERADRISRLAGLERVSTVRQANANASGGTPAGAGAAPGQLPGYFDAAGNPVYTTKMSTVGSASATGSGGQTTTWASGSAKGQTDADDDEMSMDTNYRDIDDRDRYSASALDEEMDGDGMSDDISLVGFGEGAGSTVSGPTYSRSNITPSQAVGKSGLVPSHVSGGGAGPTAISEVDQQRREALGDDAEGGTVDAAPRTGGANRGSGVEAAEKILRGRLDDGDGKKPALAVKDEANLGQFYFEEKN